MQSLTDFRSQYPQYNDLSDKQLSDSLYLKYYSDLPRAVFDEKLQHANAVSKISSGMLPTSESVQRGFVASVLGAPGEIQQAVNAPFNWAMRGIGLPQYQAGNWPTTAQWENILPGKEEAARHQVSTTVGELIPGLLPLGGAVTEIPSAVKGVAEAAKAALPGSIAKAEKTVSTIGPATDEGVLGEKMHADLVKRYDKLVANRQTKVDQLKKAYLAQPHNTERGISLAYHNFLSNYQKLAARDLTPEENELISELKIRIGGDPSMTRIESERRFLGQVADGKIQKYAAIRKILALQIKNELENIIRARVPAGGEFIDAYKNLSEPINLFEGTTGGKKIVSEASPYLKDTPKYQVEVLPREFFKNRSSIRNLLTLSGGDKKFVSDAAGEYAASQLKGLSADGAKTWLAKNEGWLNEVPAVKNTVQEYVSRLEKATYTHERAKKAIDAAAYGTAAATGGVTSYWILKHLLGM